MSRGVLATFGFFYLCSAAFVALLLYAVACGTPRCSRIEHDACWYGETLTDETRAEIARVLPLLPADPWPCVETVTISDTPFCPPSAATCYWPNEGRIESTQAGLVHELAHAAAECASGDPDYNHTSPWWAQVHPRSNP